MNGPTQRTSFPDCPDRPNCVSSLARDARRRIAPFAITGDAHRCLRRLIDILNTTSRTTVTRLPDDVVHAKVKTLVLRQIDDLYFWLDPKEKVIQVWSASRKGYWDLGKNRRRIESLRKKLNNDFNATSN